jgi:hypothetical protein
VARFGETLPLRLDLVESRADVRVQVARVEASPGPTLSRSLPTAERT